MQRFITIITLVLFLGAPVHSQTVPSDLVEAIGKGNAGKMSEFFHQSLEMTLLKEDYTVSKNQATRIMDNFFQKNKPSGFDISFEGTKEQSKYAIGTLKTENGSFRINLFFLQKGGSRLIYYISIEKESKYAFE